MKKIITIVGTRPDAIKLIPIHQALIAHGFKSVLCATYQHDDLLEQVFKIFNVKPDIKLSIMRHNQDLFHVTTEALNGLKDIYVAEQPDLVIVQGDTTTAFCAALAAFYKQIPIAHVEAGLRTGNFSAPYPEEMNRCFISLIATYHFAPTALNFANLLKEGINPSRVFLTGNTGIDALFRMENAIRQNHIAIDSHIEKLVSQIKQENKKLVLLTAHRRESFHGGLEEAFIGIRKFLEQHHDVVVISPVHPNPNVTKAIEASNLLNSKNVILTKPLTYQDLVFLELSSDWVITDSGGIQEEAMSLGKKVIILRTTTERLEGIWEGCAYLAGTDQNKIIELMEKFYFEKGDSKRSTTYGDGSASNRIVKLLQTLFDNKTDSHNMEIIE
jgi:UDP-N-acetylglucosamine 2-epimerase (non-hydrolysing)